MFLLAEKNTRAMRRFRVTITETLRMTVEVDAADQREAEQRVSDDWRNSTYVLDSDNFIGVAFDAAPLSA